MLLAYSLTVFPATPQAQPQRQAQMAPSSASLLIPRGQVLYLEFTEPLDWGKARKGDAIPLRLMRPLALGGVNLLPEGTMFAAKVTRVKHGKCGPEVKWDVKSVTLPDGSNAQTEIIMTATRGATVSVPEMVPIDRLVRNKQHGLKEAILLAPVMILLAPPVLFMATIASPDDDEFGSGRCAAGNYIEGVGTKVGLAFSTEHRVSY